MITGFAERRGSRITEQGYVVDTTTTGDKFVVRIQGTDTIAQDGTMSGDGKWSFVSGTGKLRGVKGTGTYKCKGESDGSANCDVEGEYTLPAPKK